MNDSEIKEIVIARLDVLPIDRKISIGNEGTFSKEELINHVESEDRIGRKIIEIQLTYLQSLKKGILTDE